MSDIEKPRIEELADEVALWNSYRQVHLAKGIDVTLYGELAAEQKQSLTSPGAREDFTELCEAGCLQLALAAIVSFI